MKWKLGLYRGYIIVDLEFLFGDTMVRDIEYSVLLLGCSILYKEYNLTGFNHKKKRYSGVGGGGWVLKLRASLVVVGYAS